MGPGNAAEMLMSARRVGAEEALAKGLVSRLLPRDGFSAAARAYASDLAQGAPASFAMMKHQLRNAGGGDFGPARASAADGTRKTLDPPDIKEELAGKHEVRGPRFEPVHAGYAPPKPE